MQKNKSYVIYDKSDGSILAVYSMPFEPVISGDHGFISGKCSNIKEFKVDLATLKLKRK